MRPMPKRSRSNARSPSTAVPKPRATIMPNGSGCSAPRSNPPTTPSSPIAGRHYHRLEFSRGTAVMDTPPRRPWAGNISLIVPPGRLPEVEDTARRIGWGERIEQNETVRLRKDGTPVEVSLSIAPIKAASGSVIGISKTVRDITETKPHPTRNATTGGRAAADLRNIAGSDPGGGFSRMPGPGQPELRDDPGLPARGDDRPYGIGFIHPDDLEIARAEMRRARRGQRSKCPNARHRTRTATPSRLRGSARGRSRSGAISSSAAT